MASTIRTATLVPALPVKARLTRRDAISGAGAAALGLATGGVTAAPAADAQIARSALLDLARSIQTLVARCDTLADKVASAEDAIPLDASPETEAAEVERLGLPALRVQQDRAEARLDRAAARLGDMMARSPAEVAAKAAAVLELLGPDWITQGSRLERHSGLVGSALRDAAALGASA